MMHAPALLGEYVLILIEIKTRMFLFLHCVNVLLSKPLYTFFYKNTIYKNVRLEKLKNQEHFKNNKA